MSSAFILSLPEGNIKFAGFPRGGDEYSHPAFEITLPNRPPIYGEWKTKFAANGNDFDVEIVSFGYSDAYNLGNPHPDARLPYSEQDVRTVERLVRDLFATPEARAGVPPFGTPKAVFLGAVTFRSEWIRQRTV
jgi:hypothetical protein